ncbi:MAG TPA: malto-oligosyltrehalose synthase [Rhodocyclaceae bacterium]|nr:malto-oligosyltrehalose synthase [Rhodocyclaceae bacterium]
MTRSAALRHLADLYGIEAEFTDVKGVKHVTSDATREKLLAAMGLPMSEDLTPLIVAAEEREWRSALPPVRVLREDAAQMEVDLTLPEDEANSTWHWALLLENGERRQGSFVPSSLQELARRELDGRPLVRWRLALPPIVDTGYHRLQLEPAVEATGAQGGLSIGPGLGTGIIVTPTRCYWSEHVREEAKSNGDGGSESRDGDGRVWGIAVQLYGLRSERNWGMGDFGDLRRLVDIAASAGAGFIGLNPLHALFGDKRCSPYSPSSRLFCNPLYLDVEAVPDFQECEAAQTLWQSAPFQERLNTLRSQALVDYPQVTQAKREVLRLAYANFRERHLAACTEHALSFLRFRDKGSQPLAQFALFEALHAHFQTIAPNVWGWPAWPEEYRSPQSSAVRNFAAEYAEEIEYHLYLQWLCHQQLGAAAQRAWLLGLGLGLYHDLALGVDPGGAEAWLHQELYALEMHLGAPPDDFSPLGQDWGLPPLVPWRLRDAAYAPFITTLRANMRHGGVLRIDHVMGLMRLYWVPAGASSADGAYVRYPLEDLLGILALESQRQRCMVVGEDLGTVPEQLRPTLAALGVLSYRPLYFERDGSNNFKPPGEYPRQALAVVSTHDLPTLRGFWQGRDIAERARLGLLPAGPLTDGAWTERDEDRRRLMRALDKEKLLPEGESPPFQELLHSPSLSREAPSPLVGEGRGEGGLGHGETPPHPVPAPRPTVGFSQPTGYGGAKQASRNPASAPQGEREPNSDASSLAPPMDAPLAQAVHTFMARTPCMMLSVQAEDIFGVVDQANLPGTTDPYPNWRRRDLPPLETWAADPRFISLAEALRRTRGPATLPVHEAAPSPEAKRRASIPRATYRVQFNSGFTLSDATSLVPYLHSLGISHLYTSPYLKSRPGSNHGYDIVDHNALNPEIGTSEDLQALSETLHDHGMGQILDMVPNHMAVLGADNAWWLDVLENGRASPYAKFFDIEWQPGKAELQGKVLLPILADHYGTVLTRGDLQLAFDAAAGEFSIHYGPHHLPVDPAEYPQIIGYRFERLTSLLGEDHSRLLELQTLLTALGHLPARSVSTPQKIAERSRDKAVHKRHLAALCADSTDIAQHIGDNVAAFNGRPNSRSNEPASQDLLHGLIKTQGYRLAHWRVASDEINYRRFFDINELAALRQENQAAFDATHRFVLSLVEQGHLQGLRIDHADGLFDPGNYFRRLQEHCSGAGGESTPFVLSPSKDLAKGQDRTSATALRPLPLYIVIEKILAEHERLRDDWPIHGGTGYRFAHLVDGLFVESAAERRMSRIYAEFIEEKTDFNELMVHCKLLIIRSALQSELNMLANRLARIAASSRHTCDFTLSSLRRALADVVACFPVYRTYITGSRVSPDDRRHIEWAVAVAKKHSPAEDLSVYDFIRAVLTKDIASDKSSAYHTQVLRFAMKFQQYTAPVMAKGVEDTAFYRYHRLVSLNEVGGDPRRFGISVTAFHAAMAQQQEHWPHQLLAGSTHDSKRSEDVRARIHVLTEVPALWKLSVQRWSRLNRSRKQEVDERPAPTANDEYLLYQTLFGSWPWIRPGEVPDEQALADYRARIQAYMQKAVREAKEHTSWINCNQAYEDALAHFVETLLTAGPTNLFLADFVPLVQGLAPFGLLNSLAQTLIRLTAPGVPDIYQGSELWQFNLVDPDNRRPVDYEQRRRLLEEVRHMAEQPMDRCHEGLDDLSRHMDDGRIKLYLIWRTLHLRREWADVFEEGEYLPLAVEGPWADHVVAFARRFDDRTAVTIAPRLMAKLVEAQGGTEVCAADWGETRVAVMEGGRWMNVMTGQAVNVTEGKWVSVAQVLRRFPVGLLAKEA